MGSTDVSDAASQGSTVLDGAAVFALMDTHGLPFEIIVEELRHRGLAFDVLGFCRAAARSRNWRAERLERLLHAFAGSAESRRLVSLCIRWAYDGAEDQDHLGSRQ